MTDDAVLITTPFSVDNWVRDMYERSSPLMREYDRYVSGHLYDQALMWSAVPLSNTVTMTCASATGKSESNVSFWLNEWFRPPPLKPTRIFDVKVSASRDVLNEYMPDTRPTMNRRGWWDNFNHYVNGDGLLTFDIETAPVSHTIYPYPDWTPPPRTFKDEPHYFKHDKRTVR